VLASYLPLLIAFGSSLLLMLTGWWWFSYRPSQRKVIAPQPSAPGAPGVVTLPPIDQLPRRRLARGTSKEGYAPHSDPQSTHSSLRPTHARR